jgi:hypothetical protein
MTKTKPLPPLELVQQLLDYDLETGIFKWKTQRRGIKIGQVAGKVFQPNKNQFYCAICINYTRYYAHRLAYYICTSVDPGCLQIDHIDGNGLNNSFGNLRLATGSQNIANQGKRQDNTSGYKGVSRHRSKWRAEITVNNSYYYLGLFETPELAHMAYCKAAAELHGEFARGA